MIRNMVPIADCYSRIKNLVHCTIFDIAMHNDLHYMPAMPRAKTDGAKP